MKSSSTAATQGVIGMNSKPSTININNSRASATGLSLGNGRVTTRVPVNITVPGGGNFLCLLCGALAVLSNYDGEYCRDCMQIHLVEKMFANLTEMQRPKTNDERLKRKGEIFNHDGQCGKIIT